jgi:hypothetical protein
VPEKPSVEAFPAHIKTAYIFKSKNIAHKYSPPPSSKKVFWKYFCSKKCKNGL